MKQEPVITFKSNNNHLTIEVFQKVPLTVLGKLPEYTHNIGPEDNLIDHILKIDGSHIIPKAALNFDGNGNFCGTGLIPVEPLARYTNIEGSLIQYNYQLVSYTDDITDDTRYAIVG